MTQPVVLLERLTQSEIDYYTDHRRRRRPERRKKTEAYKNLRDVERVDFSLYDEYRQKRKKFLKKGEKKKRSPKKVLEKQTNEVPKTSSVLQAGLNIKDAKKATKRKRKEKSDVKPKKKLRRVRLEESDSDVENYGLVYEGGNDTLMGMCANTFAPFNTVPPQYIDFDYVPTSAVNQSDDILTALDIGPKNDFDFQENQFDMIPDDVDISKYSAISENEEELSAFTSKLIESVTSDCSAEDFEKQWDVVGGILNQMDTSYSSRKFKVPNSYINDPVPKTPLPEENNNFNIFNKENISHNLSHEVTFEIVSSDVESEVSKVMDILLKKVSARMKRFTTLCSKNLPVKTGNKTCALCRNFFVQIKNETMCSTCKAYAVGQLTSGPKKIEKQITPSKTVRFLPVEETVKPKFNHFKRHSPQHYLKSAILLSSPLKPRISIHSVTTKINKKKTGINNFTKNHSLNRSKVIQRSILKNFSVSERHRLLYKNKSILVGNKIRSRTVQNCKINYKPHTSTSDHTYMKTVLSPTIKDSLEIKQSNVNNANTENNNELVNSENVTYTNVENDLLSMSIDKDDDIEFSPLKNVPSNASCNLQVTETASNEQSENTEKSNELEDQIVSIKNAKQSESKTDESISSHKSNTEFESNVTIKPLSISSESVNSIVCNYVLPTSTVIRAKYSKQDEEFCLENVEAISSNNNDRIVSKVQSTPLTESTLVTVNSELPVSKAKPIILNTLSSSISITPMPTSDSVCSLIPVTQTTSINSASQDCVKETSCLPLKPIDEDSDSETDLPSADKILSQSSLSVCDKQTTTTKASRNTPGSENNSQPLPKITKNINMQRDLVDLNSSKKFKETVLLELEAFAILSVVDLEESVDNMHLHIERLLRKEIRNLNCLNRASKGDKNMKPIMESKHHKIKCLMFASILWTKCGSLEKVEEFVSSKQISKAMTTASAEFESKKHDNDLESWFSTNVAVQAKKEKFTNSDCMFSKSNTSDENSTLFNSSGQTTSQLLNSNRPPAPPFIEDTFTDFEEDIIPVTVNPKAEVSTSCMFNRNTTINSVANPSAGLNNTMSALQVIPSSALPTLEQLSSHLQSPIASLTSSNFNPNAISGITNIQPLLPVALPSLPSQTLNPYESNINNGSMMSPNFQVPSPNLRNFSNNGNNIPCMSPQILQAPSQSFNQLDSNSLITQNIDSRRDSRNSTSSGELLVPQMSPVHIKQERLDKSPCPSMNNALVPYNFFPTPSPTPPQTQPTVPQFNMQLQPYNPQVQQQLSQNQLQQLSQGQLQQLPPNQFQQGQSQFPQRQMQQFQQGDFQQFSQGQRQITPGQIQQLQNLLQQRITQRPNLPQPVSQPQQNSPQYANIIKQLRYQISNAPAAATTQQTLRQILPVLLNQASSQPQRNVQRPLAPNKTVSFGTALQPGMNRNVVIQSRFNSNLGTDMCGPPNVTIPIQNPNTNANRTIPNNLSVQLQQSNQMSGSVQNAGVIQQTQGNNSVLVANPPVNLQQILLAGGTTSNSNQSFVVPYSNASNSYNTSQSVSTARQPNANPNNVLFSMLTQQPQSNVYAINTQPRNQPVPPPPYSPTTPNPQNNVAVVQQSNNNNNNNSNINQRDKQLPPLNHMYCAVCSKPATMRCKQCTKVVYCNASCARVYWNQKHKMECKASY